MTMKIEQSTGNVFREIGFGPKEAESLRLRAQLMVEVTRLIRARKLTQRAAAKLLELPSRGLAISFAARSTCSASTRWSTCSRALECGFSFESLSSNVVAALKPPDISIRLFNYEQYRITTTLLTHTRGLRINFLSAYSPRCDPQPIGREVRMPNFRILSCDGGGIRGVLTAVLLNRLSGAYPALLQNRADTITLFAGTSTGGIFGAGSRGRSHPRADPRSLRG